MPIVGADLQLFCAANHPVNDTDPSGGAINLLRRPEFTQFAGPAQITLASDGADLRAATLIFRTLTGALSNEIVILNNTTEVQSVATAERLLSVTLDSTDAARTVTVKEGAGGTTRATIPVNELGISAGFITSASQVGAVARVEKYFFRNSHASLTLNSAVVTLTADPAARIKMGLALVINDNVNLANRLATPAGVSFVDDGIAVAVPGGLLAAGDSIGVWVQQGLLASDSPFKNLWTLTLTGVSA